MAEEVQYTLDTTGQEPDKDKITIVRRAALLLLSRADLTTVIPSPAAARPRTQL